MIEIILIYLLTFVILCVAFYGPMYVVKKHLYNYHKGTKDITVGDCFKFILQFIKFTVLYPYYYISGRNAIYKSPTYTFDQKSDHVDIIIVIYTGIYWYKNIAVFCSGFDILLSKLVCKSYNIYLCYTRDDVKRVISNPDNKKIWIFGHGRKYRLEFGDEFLYYEEMKYYPKKEYIKQVHCNPYGGKSLVDYLCEDKSKSFVSDGDVFAFENREYIENWKYE